MADLSQYSTEQLQGMLNQSPKSSSDLSKYSSEQLVQMLNQQAPTNEQPAVTENPGSHPTYGAPQYNSNPFTALVRGVNSGAAGIQNMSEGLAFRFLGANQQEAQNAKDFVNPRVFKPETIPPSRPGTGANIAENIGQSAAGSIPAVALSAIPGVGPIFGWGGANAIDAFSQYKNPFMPFIKGAAMGKGAQLLGGAGSALVPSSKVVGSALGGAVGGAAVSGGSPEGIIQGGALGAAFPQEPIKKSDVIPFGNSLAYGFMKDYMKPWAKDFKYMHDPVRGWLNEGLTANNADQAAKVALERKNEIGQGISETIANSSQNGVTSNYSGVLKPLYDQMKQLSKSPKSNASSIARIQNAIDDINLTLQKTGTDLTPEKAFELKQQVDDLTKWTGNSGDDKPVNAALQDSYRVIRNGLNKQIPALKDFNQRYGDISEAVKRLQYRADASNPMLKGIDAGKSLLFAGLLGHGNPALTTALIGAEMAGKTAAVKTRLSNALYSRPDFAGVPGVSGRNPNAPTSVSNAQFSPFGNPFTNALPNNSNQPLGIPNMFSDRAATPADVNIIKQGNEIPNPAITGERPPVPYALGPEGIPNTYKPGSDSITTARPKIKPETKQAAKDQINDIWAKGLGINIPKAMAITGATALGAGMFGGQAQAAANIDMNKIYQMESSGNPEAYNKSTKASGLGQVTPIVVKDWNNMHPDEKYSHDQMQDGEINQKVSSWYMNERIPQLLKHYKLPDNTRNRLISYNAGIDYVKQNKPLKLETKNYIKKYGAT